MVCTPEAVLGSIIYCWYCSCTSAVVACLLTLRHYFPRRFDVYVCRYILTAVRPNLWYKGYPDACPITLAQGVCTPDAALGSITAGAALVAYLLCRCNLELLQEGRCCPWTFICCYLHDSCCRYYPFLSPLPVPIFPFLICIEFHKIFFPTYYTFFHHCFSKGKIKR